MVGFAINFITPVVNAGGEPYRAAALAAWLGTRRAAGSVLQYALLHAISSLLMWLTAIGFALLVGQISGEVKLALAGAAAVIAVALLVVLTGHRHGFVGKLTTGLARLRLGRFSRWLAARGRHSRRSTPRSPPSIGNGPGAWRSRSWWTTDPAGWRPLSCCW